MNRKHFVKMLIIYLSLMIFVHLLHGGRIPPDRIIGMDKLLHTLEYIIFAFLFINSLRIPNINKVVIVIVIGAIFGIIIELLQLYVAGRYASAYDAIANVIGLFIGSIITYKYLIFSNDKESIY